MGVQRVDYRDAEGIQRRVLLPAGSLDDPAEGVPVSVPVDTLYLHMPLSFRISLIDALWAVGLVEPEDFLKLGAAQQVQAALISIVKHDAMSILALAKEVKHG